MVEVVPRWGLQGRVKDCQDRSRLELQRRSRQWLRSFPAQAVREVLVMAEVTFRPAYWGRFDDGRYCFQSRLLGMFQNWSKLILKSTFELCS